MLKSKELDQFYTSPSIAIKCYKKLCETVNIDNYHLVEPSAGSGSFSNLFHSNSTKLDLDPKINGIKKMDFFDYSHNIIEKTITIGNPPFGKNSSLAIQFFNKSADFSDYIAFIIPSTFKKVSIQNKLSLDMHLIQELEIDKDSFIFEGEKYSVNCVFQIWQKKEEKRIKIKNKTVSNLFKFIDPVDKHNADFAIRRVGVFAGKVIRDLDKYSPSSHYYISGDIDLFISKYEEIQEIAKNAINPSISKHELIEIIEKGLE